MLGAGAGPRRRLVGAGRGSAGRGGAVHPARRGDDHPAPAGPRAAAARPHPRPARRHGSLPGRPGRRVRQPHRTRPRAAGHQGRHGPDPKLAPTPAERRMASPAARLAEQVAAGETGRAARLPRQLVHGDFWDDNVFYRGQDPAFVADLSFMAERARIDDLALTLYYADTQFGLAITQDRIAALRPWCTPTPAGSAHHSPTPNGRHCPGPSPASPCGASAAGSRCSTTNTPPGRTPAPSSPPSDAPCS